MHRLVKIVSRLDFAVAVVLVLGIVAFVTVPLLFQGDIGLGVRSSFYLLPFVMAFLLAGYLLRRGVCGMWWYQLLPIAALVMVLGATEILWGIEHVPQASTTSPDGAYVITSYAAPDDAGIPNGTILTIRHARQSVRSLGEQEIFRGSCHGEMGFRWVKTNKLLVSCDRFEHVTARNIGTIYVQYVPSVLYEFENISAPRLLEKIQEMGAREVLDTLFMESTITWRPVLDRIARGEEEWLRAAVLLFAVSDGHAGSELLSAISSAILSAPDRVLALPGKQLTLRRKCGDAGDEIGPIHAPDFYPKAIEVLKRTSDPKLSSVRNQCIKIMETFVRS